VAVVRRRFLEGWWVGVVVGWWCSEEGAVAGAPVCAVAGAFGGDGLGAVLCPGAPAFGHHRGALPARFAGGSGMAEAVSWWGRGHQAGEQQGAAGGGDAALPTGQPPDHRAIG